MELVPMLGTKEATCLIPKSWQQPASIQVSDYRGFSNKKLCTTGGECLLIDFRERRGRERSHSGDHCQCAFPLQLDFSALQMLLHTFNRSLGNNHYIMEGLITSATSA